MPPRGGEAYELDYETVAVSQTDQILGLKGATGNVLLRLIVTVTTADATSAVTIKDGDGSAIPIVPASAPIGVYPIEIGAQCLASTTPGWKVTTLAGATVLAVGRFT